MDEKLLQEIGLTNSEITVYLTLLKSGSVKVGNLMKQISLHRSRIYEAINKLTDKGVVSYVNYKGSVEKIIYQLIGGLRQGLGYCGAKNIRKLYQKAKFIKISNAGLRESHPHNLQSIKKAPNYRGDFL